MVHRIFAVAVLSSCALIPSTVQAAEVGGRISGTITDATTGAPLSGVIVAVFASDGLTIATTVNSNTAGVYTTVALPAGTYFARNFNTGIYLGKLYRDLPCPFECDVTSGAPIVVTAGATTGGIDFALVKGARIAGSLTDAVTGAGLGTVAVVDVYDASGTYLTTAAAATGPFTTSALPSPAHYFLRTRNSVGYIDELYDDRECLGCVVTSGTPVAVTTGTVTTGIQFALNRGGRISGRITNATTGLPIAGVAAQIRRLDGFLVTAGSSNSSGTYVSSTGLPSGAYRVRTANGAGYVDEAYDDIVCVGCAATTGLEVGVTTPATTIGIDFALAPGGRIAGTILDETTGRPISGVSVVVHTETGAVATSATTNASGSYLSRAGLTPGTYFVRTANTLGYADELFDDIVCLPPCTAFATGTPIVITDPVTTSGIDFGLFHGPSVGIGDAAVREGDDGTVSAVFAVTLSAPAAEPVTVQVETADGTAAAGVDYAAASGLLTFAPGTMSQSFVVPVNGDRIDEEDETFSAIVVRATNAKVARRQGAGTIGDDDDAPVLSIADVAVAEGDSGSTDAVFTVALSAASSHTVTVQAATADGTAQAGSDYAAVAGILTFAPGVTRQTFVVSVAGDVQSEPDEAFRVTLSAATNATVGVGTASGIIRNDDAPPSLSIGGASVDEGDSGTTPATFTVTLSAPSAQTVAVTATTADDTARAGADYTATSAVLTFAPGVTSQTVTVPVLGDAQPEGPETFVVTLSGATHATIGVGHGVGVIVDDDRAELRPAADAFVRGGLFSFTNFGTRPRLQVKAAPVSGLARRSFLRFDLRSIAVARVSRAELRVFVNAIDGRRARLRGFAVADDAWREWAITWFNQPALGAGLGAVDVSARGWVTLDVTVFVNAQLAGDRQASLALRGDSSTTALVEVHSREAATNRPVLVLTP